MTKDTGSEIGDVAGFEDGGSHHQPIGKPPEAAKGKEMGSPLELPERMQPCLHLDFSPGRSVSGF